MDNTNPKLEGIEFMISRIPGRCDVEECANVWGTASNEHCTPEKCAESFVHSVFGIDVVSAQGLVKQQAVKALVEFARILPKKCSYQQEVEFTLGAELNAALLKLSPVHLTATGQSKWTLKQRQIYFQSMLVDGFYGSSLRILGTYDCDDARPGKINTLTLHLNDLDDYPIDIRKGDVTHALGYSADVSDRTDPIVERALKGEFDLRSNFNRFAMVRISYRRVDTEMAGMEKLRARIATLIRNEYPVIPSERLARFTALLITTLVDYERKNQT